jgi:iron complex outermembrane receptor protein
MRDQARGDWAGTQLTYSVPAKRIGTFTLGTEMSVDLDAVQWNDIVSPAPSRLQYLNTPRRSFAFFAQDEVALSRRWKAVVGARFDANINVPDSVSPRLALVFQQSSETVWKFLYGKAFRNPTVYEMYYRDEGGPQLDNPDLRPENAHTFEVDVEKRLAGRVSLIASAYLLRIDNYIESETLPDDWFQYRNCHPLRAAGAEFEVNGRLGERLEAAASFSAQRVSDPTGQALVPNSPHYLGKLRLGYGLLKKRLWLTGSGSWVSARGTLEGVSLPGVPLAGATITTQRLTRQWDLQLGVRNLFDRHYFDPAAGPVILDRMRADGRSVYLRLIWHIRE